MLNTEVFYTLKEAQIIIERWRQEYNTVRPHSSLNYQPPTPEARLPLVLGPDRSVIEVGPGPGIFTRFLVSHCNLVTAVEPSPANACWLEREMAGCQNLAVIKQRWEDIETVLHDVVFSAGTLYAFIEIKFY